MYAKEYQAEIQFFQAEQRVFPTPVPSSDFLHTNYKKERINIDYFGF